MKTRFPFCIFLIPVLALSACSQPVTQPASETQPPAAEAPAATEPPASTAVPPTATAVIPSRPLSNLSADPQRVEFKSEDGVNLIGYYYPSKYADAPLMILMHWAGGDLCDWKDIALWMQNRADESPAPIERCANAGSDLPESLQTPWWDSSWFPKTNPDTSIAVFTFDFRGYGQSESRGSWNNTTKDALAAFETAAALEGVNPQKMASLGASIGADGAPDGCLLYNQKAGGGCVGAFSLSPGNYLGMSYAQTVKDLAPVPVWCLAAESDRESAPTCKSASGAHYFFNIYAGGDHGMMLLRPDLDPPPMGLMQEFMETVFEESVRE